MTTFHSTANDVRTTLASGHASGDGTLVVTSADSLPVTTPYYLTVVTAATVGTESEVKTLVEVTARVGTTLTVSVVAGSTDRNYASGDVVELRDVSELWEEVQSAVAALETTPPAHTHDDRYYTESEVDSLLAGKAASTHAHAIGDVTGLQSALDGKQAAGSYAAASHTHDADDIVSGELDAARIPDLSATYSVTTHNHDLVYAPLASPTFSGTVTAPTIQGSTASAGSLNLLSTSHGTKGRVNLNGTTTYVDSSGAVVVGNGAGVSTDGQLQSTGTAGVYAGNILANCQLAAINTTTSANRFAGFYFEARTTNASAIAMMGTYGETTTGASPFVILTRNSSGYTEKLRISKEKSVILCDGATTTSDTGGYVYIPTCPGAPTGTPVAWSGRVAMVFDDTNGHFYIYSGGWKKFIPDT